MTQNEKLPNGLTKLEHFAAMALQGFCSHKAIAYNGADTISNYALEAAKELLELLESEQTTTTRANHHDRTRTRTRIFTPMTPAELQAFADQKIAEHPDPKTLGVVAYWQILNGLAACKITVPQPYREAMMKLAITKQLSI
jgi:hypothetical protein